MNIKNKIIKTTKILGFASLFCGMTIPNMFKSYAATYWDHDDTDYVFYGDTITIGTECDVYYSRYRDTDEKKNIKTEDGDYADTYLKVYYFPSSTTAEKYQNKYDDMDTDTSGVKEVSYSFVYGIYDEGTDKDKYDDGSYDKHEWEYGHYEGAPNKSPTLDIYNTGITKVWQYCDYVHDQYYSKDEDGKITQDDYDKNYYHCIDLEMQNVTGDVKVIFRHDEETDEDPTTWESCYYIHEVLVVPKANIPQGPQKWENITWEWIEDAKLLYITGEGDMPSVAETEYPWYDLVSNYKRLGSRTMQDYVQNIIIDDGITSIGANAFSMDTKTTRSNGGPGNVVNTPSLFSISIGKNVKTIGANAFACSGTKFLSNGGITNQAIGSNAFNGLTSAKELQYTKANSNFYKLVKGKFEKETLMNSNGYVEIVNSTDWMNKIVWANYNSSYSGGKTTSSYNMDKDAYSKVYGRYEIVNDFNMSGNIKIETVSGSTKGVKTVNGDFYPYILRTNINGSYEREPSTFSNDFYGILNGNGNTIGGVKNGLFVSNYGIIKDLNLNTSKGQDYVIKYEYVYNRRGKTTTFTRDISSKSPICYSNYGLISAVETEGNWYNNNSAAGAVGYNYGKIQKTHFSGTITSNSSISGLVEYNLGTIYGCSTDGTIKPRAASAGLVYSNQGLVEQCNSNLAIIETRTISYDEAIGTSGLALNNHGTMKDVAFSGYYNFSNSSNFEKTYRTVTCRPHKGVRNNYGTITNAFIGGGFRYTKGTESEVSGSKIIYHFYDTDNNGTNKNVYTLSKTVYVQPYDIGNGTTHSAYISPNDKISDAAKQTSGNKSITHDHGNGFTGTSVTDENAKSGNSSFFKNLPASDWSFAKGGYPRPKYSVPVSITEVKANYLGDAIEGSNLDKSKIEFLVYYSNGTVHKLYGNSSDITFPYGVYIANVGSMNTVYFQYNDSFLTGALWPASGYDTFTVNARPAEPIEIVRVEYNGNPVTENMSYNLNDVRLTIKYDNGSIKTYTGSSSTVGLTTTKDPKGDINLDGVVNQSDYAMLKNLITNGNNTLTAEQKAQADINGDGQYTTKDLTALSDTLSRKVPYNKRDFYAKYSGIAASKMFTVTSVKRQIDGIYVSNLPNKTKYIEGESFEPKGMIITVKYDNGEYQTMHFVNGDEVFDGLTLGDLDNPTEDMYRGQTQIPIFYEENGGSASTFANITVRQVILTSIVVSQEPNVTTYYSGETFDERGMKIIAYYDEGVYTDERDDNWSRMEEISINDCVITGGERLLDSTNYILVQADVVDEQTKDLYGYKRISKRDVVNYGDSELVLGLHDTIEYDENSELKSLDGEIVGNNYVTISYTENNVTKSTIQPVQIEKKKLTKIDIYQMPHKVDYIVGDKFNTSGLIAKAYYTDGTTEFIYEKTAENQNGYEVVNGSEPLPIVAEMTIQYTNNGTTCYAQVPITVANNDIESISAAYTGPTVDIGRSYMKNLVMINVMYKNGSVESFYADKQVGGSDVVTIYRKGTNDIDTVIHKDSYSNVEIDSEGKYVNTFTAVYAGFEADFTVTGVETITQLDFSESTAHGRRDASDWSEKFRAVKMKAVYDYINQYATMGDSGLATIDEKNPTGVVAEQINPLLWFEREGDWVQPVTNFVVEYKARTAGFLFPETGFNDDGSIKYDADDYIDPSYYSLPYLSEFRQDREELRNPTQRFVEEAGWSDWVRNGDTVGTVTGRRIAYDYTEENPNTRTKTMYIGSAKFRLNTQNNYEFQADENPQLKIYVNGSTTPYTVTKDNEVTINNIQTMRIELAGKVRVRDNQGVENLHDFATIYKVGYKIGTANEPYEWNNGWVGSNGINAECFEIKIQLSTAPIDDFSFSTIPFIATHPEDTEAVIGNTTIFYVKAVGQNLSYQWYRIAPEYTGDVSRAVSIGGANSYFYETPAVTKNDDGATYFCIVKNGTGETQTNQAVLTARDTLPEIMVNIEDQAIPDGQEFTFSVAATSKIPEDIRFQWEMTKDDGTWEIVQTQSTNNSYTLVASADNHNRYIRCKVTNTRGHVYSNPARIAAVINPVVELTSTANIITLEGSATFNAYVTSYGGSPTFEWYIKSITNGTNYEKLSTTANKLVLSGIDAGEYKVKCVVTDTNGMSEDPATISTNDANALSIKIGDAPTLKSITYSVTKTGTTSDITGTINVYKATFNAVAENSNYSGNTLKYEWYKNGQLDGSSTSNSYTLENLQESTQVAVMCRVSDNFGKAYRTIQFLVGEIPTTVVN